MKDVQTLVDNRFLIVSIVGMLFVLTEIVLRYFGKSICSAVGCKLVASYARFGNISILLIGFLTFSLLITFTVMSSHFNKTAFGEYINLVLIVSLACEGYFTGFQAFRIHRPCIFCLTVFGFMVTLGLLRLLQGEREIIAGFAAMAGVFSLCYLILPVDSTERIEGHPAVPKVGQPAPEFDLTLLNGQKVALKDFLGKLVVIIFWSSGCPHCLREAPILEAVYKQYYKQSLAVVGVNVIQDQESKARAFVEKYKLTFPVGHDASGEIISLYAVQAVPTIILVDKVGKLIERHEGELTKLKLRQRIDALLK